MNWYILKVYNFFYNTFGVLFTCQQERADREGGARVEVEVEAKTVLQVNDSESDSQETSAESFFTHNFYLLKVCLLLFYFTHHMNFFIQVNGYGGLFVSKCG